MALSRLAAESETPQIMTDPKTNWDKLRNQVLMYLGEKDCKFPKKAGTANMSFVQKLVDLLYYMDGQYSKMEAVVSITKSVPKVFKAKFTGFNPPQKNINIRKGP